MGELAVREVEAGAGEVAALVYRIADFVDVFGHSCRLRIAAWAYAHPEETFSAKMMSEEFGMSLGAISYHVRKMHELRLLRLVNSRRRRGAVEKFYLLTARGFRTVEKAEAIVATLGD